MEYHYKIHKAKKGYWGFCIELDGAVSQGETLEETKYNFAESLNLYLDEPEGSDVLFPLPRKSIKGRNILKIPVEPQIALAMLVRQERVKLKLTQAKVAEKMKVPLYSYQKLESSKTSNPEWKTLVKLKKIFPRLNLNLAV